MDPNNAEKLLPGWLFAALAVTVVAAAVFWNAKTIPFHAHVLAKAGDLLASLLVITVFVERALAVINDIWFGQAREQKEREVQLISQRLSAARASAERMEITRNRMVEEIARAPEALRLEPPPLRMVQSDLDTVKGETQMLAEKLDAAMKSATEIEAIQDRVRLRLAFLLSVIISAIGVRTLETLLDVASAQPATEQRWALVAADIVLTAGLIAGGSSGINSISELLGKYVDVMRHKANART
jgi:hypothetical protein